MSRSNLCPNCGEWHPISGACVQALRQGLSLHDSGAPDAPLQGWIALAQPLADADAAEAAAIVAYLRQRRSEDSAA
jgi:hypothetical protein